MARFFFDIRDNDHVTRDDDGMEFDNLESAIAHARKLYAERLAGPGQEGQEPAISVEIRSADNAAPSFIFDVETADLP